MGKYKPYPVYKDSGVAWLGGIPEHWQAKKLKHLVDVILSNVDKKSIEGQQSVRLCNYTDVYYNETIQSDLEFMKATATPEQIVKFTLRAGDTLITKDSESPTDIAVPAHVPSDLQNVLCGYYLAVLRPKKGTRGKFIFRLFQSSYANSVFTVRANGLTRYGLGNDALNNV